MADSIGFTVYLFELGRIAPNEITDQTVETECLLFYDLNMNLFKVFYDFITSGNTMVLFKL